MQSSSGNATDIVYDQNDLSILLNMSVWESVEALRDFVYASKHLEVLKERAKWFEKMDKPVYSPYSFWFSKLFPMPTVEPVGA